MNRKILGILVMTLLINITALPTIGITNNVDDNEQLFFANDNKNIDKNEYPGHELEIEWERFYGESNDDVFRNVKQTTDGGYIMVGVWDGESHWLLKVDSNGDEEWSTAEHPKPDYWPRCYFVEETSDGGFITTGCHQSNVYLGYDRCIWKVDGNGNTEWLRIYDDPLYGWHMCIKETDDGGYIVCGEIDVDENNPSDFDMLLMKTDANGNVEWQQIWRYGEYGEVAYAVRQTPDGGYIISGRVESSHSEADFVIIKTDANGIKEWEQKYGGESWETTESQDILFTDDGGYLFLAETQSYGAGRQDIWIIKTDSNGNMEWNNTFGGTRNDMAGGIDFTDDGGIIIVATKDGNHMMKPKGEGFIIKVDANGIKEWQHTFGYDSEDQLQGVCTTSDGGYIFAGNTDSIGTHGAGGYDGWLIKLKAFDNERPSKPIIDGQKKGEPNIEYKFTASSSDPDGDTLSYMWDWGDGNFSEWLDTNEATYTWTSEDNFKIRVVATDEHGCESEWSDPLSFSTPKNRAVNISLLRFLENHPHLLTMLRQIMGIQ